MLCVCLSLKGSNTPTCLWHHVFNYSLFFHMKGITSNKVDNPAYYSTDNLIIFSKLFVNDHESCLVVKFSTSPHICCHYTLCNTMLYFALIIHCLSQKYAPTSDHHNFNKR